MPSVDHYPVPRASCLHLGGSLGICLYNLQLFRQFTSCDNPRRDAGKSSSPWHQHSHHGHGAEASVGWYHCVRCRIRLKGVKDQQESERNKAHGTPKGTPAPIMTKGHNLIKGITNKPASKWKINLKAT